MIAARLWAPWLRWERGMVATLAEYGSVTVLVGRADGPPITWWCHHPSLAWSGVTVGDPDVDWCAVKWTGALPDPSHVGTLAMIAEQVQAVVVRAIGLRDAQDPRGTPLESREWRRREDGLWWMRSYWNDYTRGLPLGLRDSEALARAIEAASAWRATQDVAGVRS